MACAAEAWTTSGVSLTLTDLTGTLSASSDEASWALTVYTTAFAVSVAVSHRLSIHLGNRRYLTLCALLYAAASIGCAVSTDLRAFLFCRALAGFAGGVFLVRTFVFLSHQFDAAARVLPSVFFAILYFGLGRVLSPLVSGWFADAVSWRLLFVPESLVMLAAAWTFYTYTEQHWTQGEEDVPFDYPGALLLAAGAICLQFVFSRGEIDAWFESSRLVWLLCVGLVANVLFAAWQFYPRNSHPLLRFSFLRNRSAFAAAALGFALGVLLGGSLYVVPQYLRGIEGHSALQTGVLLSVGGIAAVFVLLTFRYVVALMMRIGGAGVLAIALVAEVTSQLLFCHYFTPDTPDRFLLLPLALNGVFIALSVPTLGIVAFAQVDGREVSSARAMYYGFRQLGASFGVTLAALLVDRRMSHHSSRILDAIASRNQSLFSLASPAALALTVKRQSAVLSYADVFLLMAFVAVGTIPLVLLLPKPPATTPSPPTSASEMTAAG
jgi:DHA2 family multidrug resistance protein